MVIIFHLPDFVDWLDNLNDSLGKVSIIRTLRKIKKIDDLNQIKCKATKEPSSKKISLLEYSIDTSKGYRIYFVKHKLDNVSFLIIGKVDCKKSKKEQTKDIKEATKVINKYKNDYIEYKSKNGNIDFINYLKQVMFEFEGE